MTGRLRRLDLRLFGSYAAVALICAITFAVVFRFASRNALHGHIAALTRSTGSHTGPQDMVNDAKTAVERSLNSALPVALFTGLAVSGIAAAFVSRRILNPIDRVRFAAQRLADGHFDERVPAPPEVELAELANDLNRLAASLQMVEERRVTLTADVGHELRTPLTIIEGVTQGLIDGIFEPTTESYELLLTEVSRLKRLARDFSTIAQLNEGAVTLQRVPTDIGQLVISVADRFRPQYQSTNIELITDIDPGTIRDVDPDRVSQILTNLLGNALVYTPAGGRVTATCRSSASGLQIAVTDTGIGLTTSDATRVFERFYRVADAPRPPGGTGIGLSIARRFARLHGGDLTCTSPGLGFGTTFTLTLP
jgi:signal transduction histidine kinase